MPYTNTRVNLLLSIPFRFLGINVTSLKKPCHLVSEKAVTVWNRDGYYKRQSVQHIYHIVIDKYVS